MGIKVAKFGGSSVADAIQIRKLESIVCKDEDKRYIVVSAPGKRFDTDSKITDLLYSCMMHRDHNIPYDNLFQVISDRFTALVVSLGIELDLSEDLRNIKNNIDRGANIDYLASRGEYLNGKIIAKFLNMPFIDAADVILFDSKGRFKEEETNQRLREVLPKYEKALIPGFYGSMPNGDIKTFSRGGSDITGALVARACGATIYENWTDVSGFLMADPRIVQNPKPIEKISYKELRELAYMGASVLHEDAIYPAKVENIPINIRNTNIPEDKGTTIAENVKPNADQVITGIAGSKDFTVIAIYKNKLSAERGFLRKLAGILEDLDIALEHMPSGIDTISVVMKSEAVNDKIEELVDEIKRQLQPESIEVIDNMALIATVGKGMSYRPGVSAQLFTALADSGINIRMIDQGSSEMNIIVGVKLRIFLYTIK